MVIITLLVIVLMTKIKIKYIVDMMTVDITWQILDDSMITVNNSPKK